MQQATQQAAATHSNIAAYNAADFDAEFYDASEKSDAVKKAQTATDEMTAIEALEKQVDVLRAKLADRKKTLQAQADSERIEKLAAVAKELGFDTLLDAATKQMFINNAMGTLTTTSSPIRTVSKKGAPKVFKYVLNNPASATADDKPGYERLTDELRASGKYRLATPQETQQMQAALQTWEAQHGTAKKP